MLDHAVAMLRRVILFVIAVLLALLPGRANAADEPLLFFFGVGCPHCAEAEPFVDALRREGVRVESIEIRKDAAGRARFEAEVARLGITAPGIPMFVLGDRYVVGYQQAEVRAMLQGRVEKTVSLPLVGAVDPGRMSWLGFTLLIGLVDGINPCAIYVLVALLSILLHVRSRKRLLLFGGAFVLMSGVVYFLFMSAWLGLFALTGISRSITIALGVALVAMGLVNLKELVWFKQGPSLMVPDRAKPGLFRRMRAIAAASSLPAALAGVVALAFVVNLVELGCTLGLPAIYTRLLAQRGGARAAWLALYNVAYVIPLAAVVGVYALTLHRLALSERGAKVLKGISGVMLVLFGTVFIAAPRLLQ